MTGFTCARCGNRHDELPMSYGAEAPAHWSPELAADPNSELGTDQCVIKGEHFFVRGIIPIPVRDTDTTFEWGAWVSVSQGSIAHMSERWHTEGRENSDPYFGWLSTELPGYPVTVNLKTNVHTRPVGQRPVIELEPTDHPLAVEQRTGITLARVQEIAEWLLH